MSIFFTADTHFGHDNIIRYCERPWADGPAMDDGLIDRWNATVRPGDTVYHLGDFTWGRRRNDLNYIQKILRKLNGTKHLIIGNHDRNRSPYYHEAGFDSVHYPYMTVEEFDLTHNPRDWWKAESPFLCAHVHTAWRVRYWAINVGVDQWGYAPVSLDRVRELVDTIGRRGGWPG